MEQKNTKTLLITKFNYSVPAEEMKKTMRAVAPAFSDIPGCCWKIWMLSEDRKEAGGVYLFESDTELALYLKSELFASVANNPAFSHLQTQTFSVEQAASILTGASLFSQKAI